MKFDKGEWFSYSTTSAATTCSFNLTASSRFIMLDHIAASTDASGSIVTVQASGTTVWQMRLGNSAAQTGDFRVQVDNGVAYTLSCNVTGTGALGYLAVCGRYVSRI